MPETAKHADQLCVINGMHADTGNHAQSFLQLHTGERLRKRPSLGSWINYGLGHREREFARLHQFECRQAIGVLQCLSADIDLRARRSESTARDMSAATIRNVASDHLPLSAKRQQVDFVQAMNREHLAERRDDQRLEGVIESMELAFRMQAAAPELLDLSNESTADIGALSRRQEAFGRHLSAHRFWPAVPVGASICRSGRAVHRSQSRQLGSAQRSPPRLESELRHGRCADRGAVAGLDGTRLDRLTRSLFGAVNSVVPA